MDGEAAEQVYLSVNTTQKMPRSTNHLYCGPSSNFAFLQLVYRTFAPVDSLSNMAPLRAATDQGIDYFRQREMFFGVRQDLGTSKGVDDSDLSPRLPLELAKLFLERFSLTVLHLVPFLKVEVMEKWLEQLYNDEAEEMASDTKAVLLAVLANGATLTEHVKWADTIYHRAKREMHVLEETVNNKAIQASLLLITSSGRANLAYLELGQACRKAYATGLHRDVEYTSPQPKGDATSERRTTFWALLFWERWVSFWLGRPTSAASDSISIPFPATSIFTLALGELSNIIAKSAKYIYEEKHLSLMKLRLSLQSVRHDLESFKQRMEPILGFALDGSIDQENANVQQFFMMNFLSHTWMTSFRPCLMVFNSMKARKSFNNSSLFHAGQTPPSPESDLFWLLEGCHCAFDSARKLIHYLFESLNRHVLLRGLSFTSACIESACLLLAYHAMKNSELIPRVKKSLEEALGCVSHMTSKEQVDSVRYTVQRMLHKIQEARVFHEGKGRAVPSSPEIGYFGPHDQLGEELADAASDNGSAWENAASFLQTATDGPGFDDPSNDGIWAIDLDIFAPDLGDYFTLDEPDFLTGTADAAFQDL
ncbi:uncharacterized protein PV07_01942 [Cladophialophora immunda]|uniref:Xylanolytic transcriptional activator regulatory domain-containing protein n=1 Tax=Cladophialophora immunda TaxID=569365 RepID=A0A0D2A4I5_9EURO|nr:uncharacterized protein PV07_01942 [Cladophialophora immunda]KIW35236.1 hypothetical protein PV07_01942 [Cladophialophora immunda]